MLGRKVIYVRCLNCSYNNVAKGIRVLDKKKKQFLFIQEKIMQVRAFERYIPLTNQAQCCASQEKHCHCLKQLHIPIRERYTLDLILTLLSLASFCKFGNFCETSHMRSFVKIKPSQNGRQIPETSRRPRDSFFERRDRSGVAQSDQKRHPI